MPNQSNTSRQYHDVNLNNPHHHKYLSSTTGDELLSNNFILSTQDKRQVLFTNQTSSSQKNNDVPMSYSSTNSKGYLYGRFQRLNGDFGPGGNSPITITDNDHNDAYDRY